MIARLAVFDRAYRWGDEAPDGPWLTQPTADGPNTFSWDDEVGRYRGLSPSRT